MLTKYSELPKTTQDQIQDLISIEFGNESVIQNNEWAMPDWCNLKFEGNKLVSFHNIVERNIYLDETEYRCGGISNVITVQESRGKGYATEQLKETESFIFRDLSCDLGLLLCGENMIPFYSHLGWKALNCELEYDQPSGIRKWQSSFMVLSKKEIETPKMIHLNGLPW